MKLSPNVVFQAFSDEVVIIDLKIGKYYSTDKMGAEIFRMALAGATLSKTQQLLEARWEGGSLIGPALADFAPQLTSEGIMLAQDIEPDTLDGEFPPLEPKMPYVAPRLNTYDDMQALLLLDPIHDVDELGWPNRRHELL